MNPILPYWLEWNLSPTCKICLDIDFAQSDIASRFNDTFLKIVEFCIDEYPPSCNQDCFEERDDCRLAKARIYHGQHTKHHALTVQVVALQCLDVGDKYARNVWFGNTQWQLVTGLDWTAITSHLHQYEQAKTWTAPTVTLTGRFEHETWEY